MNMNTPKVAPTAFKGWDACPVKNLYMVVANNSDRHDFETSRQLRKIGEQEGFQIKKLAQNGHNVNWLQDAFVINGKNSLIFTQGNDYWTGTAVDFAKKFDFKTKEAKLAIEGGNVFLGKKPDGEQFALIGAKTISSAEDLSLALDKIHAQNPNKMARLLSELSSGNVSDAERFIRQNLPDVPPEVLKQRAVETFGIKAENVHLVPQANYHLDMFMRPVGYPYVLVNDPELALKNIGELAQDPSMGAADLKYLRDLSDATRRYSEKIYKKYGKNADDVEQYLCAHNFQPVRIGAVYGDGNSEAMGCEINFLNAIVNKRPDGQIGYITNGTPQRNEAQKGLEEMFEKQLRQRVSSGIGKVHFVRGADDMPHRGSNSMTQMLMKYAAGVHCTCNEEPDFEAWG